MENNPKKRGRKPKGKILTYKKKTTDTTIPIIAHLPIEFEELTDKEKEAKLKTLGWKDKEWIDLLKTHLLVREYPERIDAHTKEPTIWDNEVIEAFKRWQNVSKPQPMWCGDAIVRRIKAGLVPADHHLGQYLLDHQQKIKDLQKRKEGIYVDEKGFR